MKRRLILHIGISKTGSTSVQSVLAAARPYLVKHGVFYPKSIGTVNHMGLVNAVRDAQMRSAPNPSARASLTIRDKMTLQAFDAEIAQLPKSCHTVVISNENFSIMAVSQTELARLRAVLEPHFDDIEILVYLRRQDEHYASNYSEALRLGELRRPLPAKKLLRSEVYYDFDVLLDRWATAFPQAVMRPRLFQRTAKKSFDAVEDFFELLDVPVPQLPKESLAVSNVSINPAGQKMLFKMKATMKDPLKKDRDHIWPVWTRITGATSQLFAGKGWRMTAEQSAHFMASYEAGNEIVRQKYFPGRETLFDDIAYSGGEGIWPDDHNTLAAACEMIREISEQAREEKYQRASLMVSLGRKYKDSELEKQGLKLQATLKPNEVETNLSNALRCIDDKDFPQAAMALMRVLAVDPQHKQAQELLNEVKNRDALVSSVVEYTFGPHD